MVRKAQHVRGSDLHGYSRLAVDAVIGLTRLVETMHLNIARVPGVLGKPMEKPAGGITGLVYRTIRGVTRLVGGGIDALLAQVSPLLEEEPSSVARESLVAALNGVLGDHLLETGNPLAIPMRLRRDGQALELTREGLAGAIPQATGNILVLLHGLCRSDLQWRRNGHDHGESLASDAAFAAPFTPVYLHYNSGLHVSTNGRAFAGLMEAMCEAWPVPVAGVTIIAHSMGGLVARSACHYGNAAGHHWTGRLRRIAFLGTPHHGVPLERGGNWVNAVLDSSPYTGAFARLGRIRSAGITDLRYGGLLDEDWRDRDRFARSGDERVAVPLPEGVECYALAASFARRQAGRSGALLGDGLVPVPSALGQHPDAALCLPIPESRMWIGYGMGHLDLLDRREVYERIRDCLAPRA
jgi:pimeloyl-ACP methyl ester carboxylesterase